MDTTVNDACDAMDRFFDRSTVVRRRAALFAIAMVVCAAAVLVMGMPR